MTKIAIIGSGMGGLGAANRFRAEGIQPTIYEKKNFYGGHTTSFRFKEGFLFDVGPHISFTKDTKIQDLFADSVDQQYETIQISLNNYWRGFWPIHPVQLHLHGLPTDIIVKIISDFVEERQAPERPINNYADWLLASFGKSFAEMFPMQYTRKYHITSAENLSTDWLGPRIYRPSLEEVLRGALSPSAPQIHYITHFRYPSNGGFVSYLNKLVPKENLYLNHHMTSLDPLLKQIEFSNSSVVQYDKLVSSVPLPDLIGMIKNAPESVVVASKRLACSTCVLVNIGLNREDISESHMTYFYDDDYCFTRLSFPHMLSKTNAPQGTGSIQAEVYFSDKYKPLTGCPDDWIDPVINDLKRCGLLREDDCILFKSSMLMQYANVIFDLERASALDIVHGYLNDIGIEYCGRYGDWGYMWTDESFISGENAAQKILDKLNS
jgi:protoporphyrinogen oxidase